MVLKGHSLKTIKQGLKKVIKFNFHTILRVGKDSNIINHLTIIKEDEVASKARPFVAEEMEVSDADDR
jgi:hypothetical protein